MCQVFPCIFGLLIPRRVGDCFNCLWFNVINPTDSFIFLKYFFWALPLLIWVSMYRKLFNSPKTVCFWWGFSGIFHLLTNMVDYICLSHQGRGWYLTLLSMANEAITHQPVFQLSFICLFSILFETWQQNLTWLLCDKDITAITTHRHCLGKYKSNININVLTFITTAIHF